MLATENVCRPEPAALFALLLRRVLSLAAGRSRYLASADSVRQVLNEKASPLAAITVLKKICDHPALLNERAVSSVITGAHRYVRCPQGLVALCHALTGAQIGAAGQHQLSSAVRTCLASLRNGWCCQAPA